MNLPVSKERDGYIGIADFRGDLIRIFQAAGFIYHSEGLHLERPGDRHAAHQGFRAAAQADQKRLLHEPPGNCRLPRHHAQARRKSRARHAYREDFPVSLAELRLSGLDGH
jgi:hypothetical protein